MKDTQDIVDRVSGTLLGLAAGDRNGGPIRMALRLAESLADCSRFDPHDIGERYLAWWREGAFDTGPVAAAVLARVERGHTFSEAARLTDIEQGGQTAGCNPAHRCAPLAMCAALPDADIPAAALAEAALTHRHPVAGQVAAAVARLCRILIRGTPWPAALQLTVDGASGETARALSGDGRPSADGYAPNTLHAAIRFIDAAETFGQALEAALGFAGAANYCPVLVGSIGGARWGRGQIEPSALSHCAPLLGRLNQVTERLARDWRTAGG